jgi:hypothetical protein
MGISAISIKGKDMFSYTKFQEELKAIEEKQVSLTKARVFLDILPSVMESHIGSLIPAAKQNIFALKNSRPKFFNFICVELLTACKVEDELQRLVGEPIAWEEIKTLALQDLTNEMLG